MATRETNATPTAAREQQADAAEELAGRVLLEPGRVLVDDVAEDQRIEQREDLVDGRQHERQGDQAPVAAQIGVEELHSVIIIRSMKPAPFLAAALVLALSFTGLAAQRPVAAEHWVATWGTAQQLFRAPAAGRGQPPAVAAAPQAAASPASVVGSVPPSQSGTQGRGGPQRRFGIPPSLPGLKNQTVRMILRASIGGSRVRVRLFNALGANTVTIGSAHVGDPGERRRHSTGLGSRADIQRTAGGKDICGSGPHQRSGPAPGQAAGRHGGQPVLPGGDGRADESHVRFAAGLCLEGRGLHGRGRGRRRRFDDAVVLLGGGG